MPFLLFAVITTLWAVDHIEDDLEDRVQEGVMAEYGVQLTDDQVDFDGRDGEIVDMVLPAGVSTDAVESFLERTYDRGADREGDISNMTVSGVEAQRPVGNHDVEVRADGTSIMLMGDVLSQAEADQLVAAAADAVGDDNVTDDLNVLDVDPASAGADDRIDGLAGAVALMSDDNIVSANAQLTDSRFDVNAIARNEAAKADLEAAIAGTGTELGGAITIDIPPTTTRATTTTTVAAASVDMQVRTDGTSITLDGEITEEAQRDALVAAAAAEVGADNVVDNLTVVGPAAPGGGDAARIDAMASLFAGFGGLTEGSGTVDGDSVDFDGTAADPAAQAEFDALVGALDADVVGSIGVDVAEAPAPTVDDEAAQLQAEFDALADEVRANVIFDPSSDVITPTAAATLDKVVDAMNRFPQPVLLVEGHTDDDGDAAANLDLSERRAQAVVAYLVGEGVDASRVRGEGFGETEPVVANDTPENKQRNRRVELNALAGFDS